MKRIKMDLAKDIENTIDVCMTSCTSYEYNEVHQAMQMISEKMDAFAWVKPGMKIALKVNLVAGMDPDASATTHPMVIRVVAEQLNRRGAAVIIGDSPGGLFTKGHVWSVYKACHLPEVENENTKLNDDFSVMDTVFDDAYSIRTFTYTGWLDKVDAIINISKFKTHAMMAMSCSVKNMFGTIPGIMKPEYHMRFPNTRDFANLMVDLNEYFVPVLQIVDAVEGMEGNGPTAGKKRHVGALIAGWSPYKTDMACANMMGLTKEDIPTLQAAFERGLGPESVKQVKICGDMAGVVLDHFELATHSQSITFSNDKATGKMKAALLKWLLGTKPVLKKNECIGCAKCSHICPAHAITMVQKKPHIDRNVCIHCFCCQEFCPKGAMKVYHNPLGNVARMIDGGHKS